MVKIRKKLESSILDFGEDMENGKLHALRSVATILEMDLAVFSQIGNVSNTLMA